jgi:hypothetical protein
MLLCKGSKAVNKITRVDKNVNVIWLLTASLFWFCTALSACFVRVFVAQ